MFIVMAVMVAGIIIGHLLRKKKAIFPIIGKINMWIIFLLLFTMGLSTGHNQEIMNNLTGLGAKAIIIGIISTCGSILAATLLYHYLFKDSNKGSK